MKRNIFLFIGGLFLGITITVSAVFLILPGQMFLVNESRFGFDETVETIIQSAKTNEWSVPHVYDLQATMAKNGFEVNPVRVISMCNPKHANNILSSNDDRLVAALMPCRLAIYEIDGKTYTSMLNAPLFSRFLNRNAKNTINDTSVETLTILESINK